MPLLDRASVPPLLARRSAGFFRLEFWRFIGFQFLHAHGSFAHILFNMIGLYFFGPLVETPPRPASGTSPSTCCAASSAR